MTPIRFALVGGGWRAAFYARIAQALPEQFTLTGAYLRSPEKRQAWAAQYGCPVYAEPEELLQDAPDFLVLSISKTDSAPLLLRLMALNVPLLCETPPAVCAADLTRVWQAAQHCTAPLQVAEQYPDWPLYTAWHRAMKAGMLGEVSNLSISAVHSYHAVSLIRRFLDVKFEQASLTGERFFFPVRATSSRSGFIPNGEVSSQRRDRVTFRFESGRTAFFDFSPVQYHSFIRTRHFSVQGTLGEIDDLCIRRLNENGLPVSQELQRMELGVHHSDAPSLFSLMLGDRCLYRNPHPYVRLNDDELAVAACMTRMGQIIRGEDAVVYPLSDALQDAYFALLMEKALTSPGEIIRTAPQPWQSSK